MRLCDVSREVGIPLLDLPFALRIARNPLLFGQHARAQLLA